MPVYSVKSYNQRPKNDFYRTPAWCTQALLLREKFTGHITDPCCGDGAILDVIKDNCSGFDIDQGRNFFDETDFYDNIVMNPPFRHALDFVQRAVLRTDKKVAAFLRLAFLEGQQRKLFLERSCLSKVYVFSKRVSFNQDNAGTMAFAWFVWDRACNNEPVIRWI